MAFREGVLVFAQPGALPAPALEQVIMSEEFAKAGVPTGGPNDVFGIQMLGNTLLQWGTEEQKLRYLPRILSGDDVWCQGYSEPNAGSDLSNVGLRGVLDGDQWILNGQKIWTSAGHLADHIFTLARTDPDAPRHKGISFLLVDMRQPGVEVRPIRMISGESEFNEVFYTDATTPKDEVIGGVNNGWAVAMTLLGYERGEAAATLPIRYQAEIDRLLLLAKERGVADDPVIRQRIAACYGKVQIMRYNGMRVLTKFLQGHHPGPDGAISKLYWSEYHKEVTELAIDILGAEALIRWRDPELGDVSPTEFIPVAERSGFIIAIGSWVLHQAVQQAAIWRGQGRQLLMSINVSALQFQQADFVDSVARVLAEVGLEPQWLELELTESILVQDAQEALHRLQALAELGVKLAIDDFGTGYSSLAYLKRFPIGRLKIDRSFIQGLPGDESDAGIVRAIVNMARALRLELIAEGVETEAQRQFMMQVGCEQYQGFLASPAVDVVSFEAMLGQHRAAALLPAPDATPPA
jgi:EAL domain-containing protein (putative c-di-GMP-specific phosphodiesterase class I)